MTGFGTCRSSGIKLRRGLAKLDIAAFKQQRDEKGGKRLSFDDEDSTSHLTIPMILSNSSSTDEYYDDDNKKSIRPQISSHCVRLYCQAGIQVVVIGLVSGILILLMLVMSQIKASATSFLQYRDSSSRRLMNDANGNEPFQIMFPCDLHKSTNVNSKIQISLPRISMSKGKQTKKPDYGEIHYHNHSSSTSPESYDVYRSNLLETIDDDDWSDDYDLIDDLADQERPDQCRKVPWSLKYAPVCNRFHETVIERPMGESITVTDYYNISYISHGVYRDAWRLQRQTLALEEDEFVLKRYRFGRRTVGVQDLHHARQEAAMLEQLSSSPHILDIYGACGTSTMSEAMAADIHRDIITGTGIISQEELDREPELRPRNNLTISEKLQIALYMAQALADLHDHPGGIIIHGDTHIEQFLIAKDGSLKLNDFNNAYTPEYHEKKQGICLASSSYGGVYRSPQELDGDYQDMSVDTYAFGSNLYTILTGLWPFYDEDYHDIPEETTQEEIIAGKRAFVDERYERRSYIEASLVEIMRDCWAQDIRKRPPMSSVVSRLQKIKRTAMQKGELMPSKKILIEIPPTELY
jgi:Protein kinase domain